MTGNDMKYIIFLVLSLALFTRGLKNASVVIATESSQKYSEYTLAWPGILPTNSMLYALKVIRNKIIAKIIYSDVKRVEFYLLMADKTLYASKLLLDKGELHLAIDTALKGENYFSMLVSVYAKISSQIPASLDKKIDRAYVAHQQLIGGMMSVLSDNDAKALRDVDYFSKTNYQLIEKIRKERQR